MEVEEEVLGEEWAGSEILITWVHVVTSQLMEDILLWGSSDEAPTVFL